MTTPDNPAEHWLVDWHDRHAGATSRAFADVRPSSYDRLASFASAGDRVLDLACGDGFLLQRLQGRGAEATGVDLSPGELAAARARLGEGALLFQARAQDLPFADGAFDLVTCHLALMLMKPVEPVLAEVHRVLRPGGRFAALVSGPGVSDDGWATLVSHLRGRSWRGPALGDRRVHDADALRVLLAAFADVAIEDFTLCCERTPDELWDLFGESYDPECLSAEDLGEVEAATRRDWADMAEDGRVRFVMGVRLVRADRVP